MDKKISSLKNKTLKEVLELKKNRVRKQNEEFGVEGFSEIKLALNNGYKISKVFYCSQILSSETSLLLESLRKKTKEIFEMSVPCYNSLVVRKDSCGVYVVFCKKKNSFLTHKSKNKALYVILDGIEKPGNLGAILRSCDACGVDQVFLTNAKVDFYNPNVIRSSLGACFSVSHLVSEPNKLYDFLIKNKVNIFSSYLDGSSELYSKKNYGESSAFVVGSEDHGISEFWLKNSQAKVIIPMSGQVDSLNASVATSVLLFEAKRQREVN